MSEKYTARVTPKDKDGNKGEPYVVSAEYNLGENLDEAVELFGHDAVFSTFKAAAVVKLQARMRALAQAGEDVQEGINDWKVGVSVRKPKDPAAKALSAFESMTEEEQKAFITALQEKVGGK